MTAAMIFPAAAQVKEAFPSYVEVNGYAEKKVVPDEFYLSITITEKDSKGKISVESQRKDMIAALRRAGVDIEKQLSTVDLSSTFYKKNNSLATAKYRLKLSSPEAMEKAYAELDEAGISNVSLSKTAYSKYNELKAQIRIAAIRNAKKRAAELAEAVGQNLGDCFYINDWERSADAETVVIGYGAGRNKAAATGSAPSDPIGFKKIEISYSVTAKFVLLGKDGKPVLN